MSWKNPPPKPTGIGPEATWYKWVQDMIQKYLKPVDTDTVTWDLSDRGMKANAAVPVIPAQTPQVTTPTAAKYIINSAGGAADVYANYFIATSNSSGDGLATGTPYYVNPIGSTQFLVANPTGTIVAGMTVSGTGIQANTTVTFVTNSPQPGQPNDVLVGLSLPTTAVLSAIYKFESGLVRIAKNYKLRNYITQQTIAGTLFNYTYTSAWQRTATSSATVEYQRVVEYYLPGDEVWAIPVSNSELTSPTFGNLLSVADTIGAAGTEIVLLDLNLDGRAWAQTNNGQP
jgi:hypothetical protein